MKVGDQPINHAKFKPRRDKNIYIARKWLNYLGTVPSIFSKNDKNARKE